MVNRPIIAIVIASTAAMLSMSSCNRTQYICSAYQSAFFVDKAYANSFFSTPVDADSQPLVARVQKNEYLLIKPIKPKKKEKSWAIVPMITVFPPSTADSSAGDSTQAVPEGEEGGQYESDGLDKTNFLAVPSNENFFQRWMRQWREGRERKRREKAAAERQSKKAAQAGQEVEQPKQAEPEKPF